MSEPLTNPPVDPGPRPVPAATPGGPEEGPGGPAAPAGADHSRTAGSRRRRGSRGGRGARRPDGEQSGPPGGPAPGAPPASRAPRPAGPRPAATDERNPDLPDPPREGRPSTDAGRGAVDRPKIGDRRPAVAPGEVGVEDIPGGAQGGVPARRAPRSGSEDGAAAAAGVTSATKRRRKRGGRGRGAGGAGGAGGATAEDGEAPFDEEPIELDEETLERRRGRERKGRPVGRYLMCVHVRPHATQIAVLEGRSLIEHYVSRPADDDVDIHGNIYLGKVQNVLPGMEAAFVDIGTPKNAVLYRGDVQYDADDVEGVKTSAAASARIEQLLRPGQTVLCQVTKNPIGTKGARLTQEVSLAGRFVVLVPNSSTYGISKRLADDERKRLRRILDDVRPAGHGIIVRTAADGATAEELRRDVDRLLRLWQHIDGLGKRSRAPALLYKEPTMAVRVIREEFSKDYRGVIIDDPDLYAEVKEYVAALIPELVDRIELLDDPSGLPIFERHHIHEQLHKALDRKVWLPSGGSLIIERTEALTVIDVNTGKNVGVSNLEETVFRNNLEAAEEIARQLRLRDIGGIIVTDFIDMEIRKNREEVLRCFKDALARDKTRTQVFEMSELGLVEMTRKRVSEGLVESFSTTCPTCAGRGIILDDTLL